MEFWRGKSRLDEHNEALEIHHLRTVWGRTKLGASFFLDDAKIEAGLSGYEIRLTLVPSNDKVLSVSQCDLGAFVANALKANSAKLRLFSQRFQDGKLTVSCTATVTPKAKPKYKVSKPPASEHPDVTLSNDIMELVVAFGIAVAMLVMIGDRCGKPFLKSLQSPGSISQQAKEPIKQSKHATPDKSPIDLRPEKD